MYIRPMLAVASVAFGLAATAAPALADFRGDRHEVFRDRHDHGKRCAYRLGAYGEGSTDFFRGGSGLRKAEARAIRHWEDKARVEFGDRFANWSRAAAKDLRCDRQGPRVICQAVAVACAVRGDFIDRGVPGGPPPPGYGGPPPPPGFGGPPGPPPRRF